MSEFKSYAATCQHKGGINDHRVHQIMVLELRFSPALGTPMAAAVLSLICQEKAVFGPLHTPSSCAPNKKPLLPSADPHGPS